MIPLTIILAILFTHWVADFVCQTDGMARNKSKDIYTLLLHCSVYTAIFIPFTIYAFSVETAIWFLIFTFILHFYVDFNTSKITSRLSAEGKYGSTTIPNFGMFSIIGLDQMFHYIFLFGSYLFLTSY